MIRLDFRALTPLAWAIIVALAVGTLSLGRCAWEAGRDAREVKQRAAASVETMTKDGAAKEVAADERLNDAAQNAALKEDLSHAVDPLPDTRPSDRRRALACARLRRQGTDTAALPACIGPGGAGKAPS